MGGRIFVAVAVVLCAFSISLAATPSVYLLDQSQFQFGCSPSGISADASTIVGRCTISGNHVARGWSIDGASHPLALLPFSDAYAASNGGQILAGSIAVDSSTHHAIRWNQTDGQVELGVLPGFTSSRLDNATSITPDGSVIVGTATDPVLGDVAFRWTAATGLVSLRTTATGATSGAGVSFDGSAIAGTGYFEPGSNIRNAYRWTQATGPVPLANLSGFSQSEGYAISGDGNTVVGSGRTSTGWLAFKWTQQTGMVSLGDLGIDTGTPGSDSSFARAVSADGSLVVGQGMDENHTIYAVIWDSSGIHKLQDYLAERNINTAGWDMSDAIGISADGSVIIGTGFKEGAGSAGWVAVVPEPALLAWIIPAACIIAARPGTRRPAPGRF